MTDVTTAKEKPNLTIATLTERLADSSLLSSVQCSICLEIFREPHQCFNGHLFCKHCIIKSLKRKKECPQCRCALSKTTICRNLFLREFIDKVKFFCRYRYHQVLDTDIDSQSLSYKEDPEGCKEAFAFRELIPHEMNCQHGRVWCPFYEVPSKKRHFIKISQLIEHINICKWKLILCNHCQSQFPKFSFKVSHLYFLFYYMMDHSL